MTFNHRKLYEINLWLYTQDANFALGNSLLGAVILTKTFCSHKYCYFLYGIGFDEPGMFWLELIWVHQCIMIIREKLSWFSVKGEQAAGKEHSISFTEQQNKFCVSLH